MKRLLVTGGCGFLGSHFVRRWLADNAETSVINIDCLTYAGALGNLGEARGDARHRHKDADVADAAAVDRAVRGPLDLVIHFAAETHVDRSLEDPGRFVRTNVLGTQTLLAAIVRRYPSPKERPVVIIMSTDEVYGPTPKNQLHGVGEPLRPTSPYAASKAGADWMALSYARTFDLDLTIVRSVNVFGPHQYPEKFIPLFIAKATAGEQMPLYGQGRQRRSWLYVDDFVNGLMAIASNDDARRERPVWHLGSPDELENRNVADMIATECGVDKSLITLVPDRPGHDYRYALDYSQTERTFNWSPQVPFADGLARTVEWFRGNRTWSEARLGWIPSFVRREES